MFPKKFLQFCLFLGSGLFFFATPHTAHAGYHYEGTVFYADIVQNATNSPVHRFYNTKTTEHFYTIYDEEKQNVLNHPEWGYSYEGIGFYAFTSPLANTIPVYRFRRPANNNHVYTVSEAERQNIINHPEWGYSYEGIGFYTYPNQVDNSVPVYRFYNPDSTRHFYTLSEIEKSTLINGNLGPNISVGLWSVSKSDSVTTPFKIQANKDYAILDANGNRIATVPAATITRVAYGDGGNLRVFESIPDATLNQKVSFQAADGNNADLIFNVFQPGSGYDHFRGQVSVRYSDTSKNLWMINTLPLEQYVWGIGEITGTGDANYNRTMTTTFRTYGLWKIYYSTAYATEGFTVDATSGNQLYYGYDWETPHPAIKQAAQDTLGRIAKYGSDIALSPYSSWTDGRTRSFQERWGSTAYPWCQSVADPYGNYNTSNSPTKTTAELEAAGNHMVGLSAHGALSLASDSHWDWQTILKYYLTGISIPAAY
jgi:hypothetical protein